MYLFSPLGQCTYIGPMVQTHHFPLFFKPRSLRQRSSERLTWNIQHVTDSAASPQPSLTHIASLSSQTHPSTLFSPNTAFNERL